MTPHVTSCLTESLPSPQNKQDKPIPSHREQIVWLNVAAFAYFHTTGIITLLFWLHHLHHQTFWFHAALGIWSGHSVTAGAHRLWAHRCYKAKWPLRLLMAIGHTITFQFDIYEWVRTHRVHHKFTDTDADPHNSKRGFFFSQLGWIMVRKHKDVIVKGRTVDMSDLERDWVIMWQRRLYLVVGPLCCFVLPTFIPIYFWGEEFWMAWNASVVRFLVTTHLSGLVNSVAHIWGTKPYDNQLVCTLVLLYTYMTWYPTKMHRVAPQSRAEDLGWRGMLLDWFKNISSADNVMVSVLAGGEGWHNYHHAFPWDYKAGELGNYRYNATTGLLDLCGKLGLAYDFKVASPEMIRKKVMRTGDGSHHIHSHEGEVWGWGDQDMDEDDKEMVTIFNPDKRRNKTQ